MKDIQTFLHNYKKKYKRLYKSYIAAITVCSMMFCVAVLFAFIYNVNVILSGIIYIVLVFLVNTIVQVGYIKNIDTLIKKYKDDQDLAFSSEIFSELLQDKTRRDYEFILVAYFKMLIITCQYDVIVKEYKINRPIILKKRTNIMLSLVDYLSKIDRLEEHEGIIEILEDMKVVRQTNNKRMIRVWVVIAILFVALWCLTKIKTPTKIKEDDNPKITWDNDIHENVVENNHEIGNNIMDSKTGCMYAYLDENQGWKLYVIDSASGTRWYALSHTTDGGNSWDKINEDPFNGEGGVVEGLAFWNEKNGFISISGMGQTYSKLLQTNDGGYNFEEVKLPMEDCTDVIDVNEYKYYYMPILKDNVLTIVVKKENVNGELGLQFQSLDYGVNWSYVGKMQ